MTSHRSDSASLPGEPDFRVLAEHAADVVALVGPDDRFTWVSPSIRDVLGWAPEDLVGRRHVHPPVRCRREPDGPGPRGARRHRGRRGGASDCYRLLAVNATNVVAHSREGVIGGCRRRSRPCSAGNPPNGSGGVVDDFVQGYLDSPAVPPEQIPAMRDRVFPHH